jgi:hypothetical protein
MLHLSPQAIARASRQLFGTGNSESLVFFVLKAEGASSTSWVRVTSSNTPPKGLLAVAGQPEGFADWVKRNVSRFQPSGSGPSGLDGIPSPPGARGTLDNYSLFFPITDERQFMLRKGDANRNAVYSNLVGGRSENNRQREGSRDDIYEILESDSGDGKQVRLKPGYVFAAFRYYGSTAATPMRIPMQAFAVWLARLASWRTMPDMKTLVSEVVQKLNLTPEERRLLFDEETVFPLDGKSWTKAFDLEEYCAALCLPDASLVVPPVTISESYKQLTKTEWDFRAVAFGLREQTAMHDPMSVAEKVIASGERNVLLVGPPRTGKSHAAEAIAARYLKVSGDSLKKDSRFTQVQFHHAWTYGDFVRKLVPTPSAKGGLEFKYVAGAFLKHCNNCPDGPSVFVIEEINRAPLAQVFGEAFHAVDKGYRDTPISLPGSVDGGEVGTLTVPRQLLLIATANDLDRSTVAVDYAFLGRCAVVECPARLDAVLSILCDAVGWDAATAERFVLLLRAIQERTGYPVGHAFFYNFVKPDDVALWYRTRLRPALTEYLTRYKVDELRQADQLVEGWQKS